MVRAGINTLTGQTAAKNRLLAMGYTVCAFKDHNRKPAKGFKAPNGAPDTAKWIEDGDDGE